MNLRNHGGSSRGAARSTASSSEWRNAMDRLRPDFHSVSLCIQQLLSAMGSARNIPVAEVAADLGKLVDLVTETTDTGDDSIGSQSTLRRSGASGTVSGQNLCRLLAEMAIQIPLPLPPAQLVATASFLCTAPAISALQISAFNAVGLLLRTPASPLSPQQTLSILRLLCASVKSPDGTLRAGQGGHHLGEEIEVERRAAVFGALESMVGVAGPLLGPEGVQEVVQAVGEVVLKAGERKGVSAVRLYVSALRTLLPLLTPPSPLHAAQLGMWVAGLISLTSYGLGPLPLQAAYRPPHLRGAARQQRGQGGEWSSGSEQSEGEGDGEGEGLKRWRVRVSALLCLTALARSDPKALHAHWPALLPTRHVLQPCPRERTLLTAVLFDPKPKARVAATSALSGMLEGPSTRPFLQVGEAGSGGGRGMAFTPLSAILGQMMVELHTGLLHGVAVDPDPAVVGGQLRALTALLHSAPYHRLPAELLPAVVSAVQQRLRLLLDLSSSADSAAAAAAAVACIGAAFSATPPLLSPLLFTLLLLELVQLTSTPPSHSNLAVDAYQALCCAAQGYPLAMHPLWPRLSSAIGDTVRSSGGNVKAQQAAMKLLDALLQAVSGVESESQEKEEREGSEGAEDLRGSENELRGLIEWEEALGTHLSACTNHRAPTVRAASMLCFAGLSAALYQGLPGGRREEVVRQVCAGATLDDSPAVRSAACRALGVMAAFPPSPPPQLQAAVLCACCDPSLSVRTTAVWALASVCHTAANRGWEEVGPLAHTALLVASEEADKVVANAVRAVGHLAACMWLPGGGGGGEWEWVGRAVQHLLGLLRSGNVKVQWNVCHALAQMMHNPTLALPQAAWAPDLFCGLVTLLGQTRNYKIRIQCLGALAVPQTKEGEGPHATLPWMRIVSDKDEGGMGAEYGESFTLVLQALGDAVEAAEGYIEADSASDLNCRKVWEEQVGNFGLTPVLLNRLNVSGICCDVLVVQLAESYRHISSLAAQ